MTSLGRSAARKTDERAARSTREIQGDLRVFVLTGRLLQAFAFEGSGAVKELMAALDVIRATYASGLRKLLASPPIRFVPRRWRPFVLTKAGVDRAGYELCAFSELRERLRAGDVWVAGSRRYRAFDDDLLPRPTFEALKTTGRCRSPLRRGSRTTLRAQRSPGRGRRIGGSTRQGRRSARRAAGRDGVDDHALRATMPSAVCRLPSSQSGRPSTTASRAPASPTCSSTSTPGPASPTAPPIEGLAVPAMIGRRSSPACSPTDSTSA